MRKERGVKQMQSLNSLLQVYKDRFIPPQASVEKVCAEVISGVTPFTITTDQITYTVHTKTIHLSVPSIVKTELTFYHNIILQELKNRLPKQTVPERIS